MTSEAWFTTFSDRELDITIEALEYFAAAEKWPSNLDVIEPLIEIARRDRGRRPRAVPQ